MCAERDVCATCAERDVELSQRVEPRSGLDISRALNATHSISRSVRYVSVCAVLKIQAVQHNCWLNKCWLNIGSRLSAIMCLICTGVFGV